MGKISISGENVFLSDEVKLCNSSIEEITLFRIAMRQICNYLADKFALVFHGRSYRRRGRRQSFSRNTAI